LSVISEIPLPVLFRPKPEGKAGGGFVSGERPAFMEPAAVAEPRLPGFEQE
jgi:hypothetical protein